MRLFPRSLHVLRRDGPAPRREDKGVAVGQHLPRCRHQGLGGEVHGLDPASRLVVDAFFHVPARA